MFKQILPAILLLASATAFSQSSKPSLTIYTGAAIPIGHFAGDDNAGSENGFAKIGPLLNIAADWSLNKKWGVEVAVHGQLNPLDTKGLESAFFARSFYTALSVGTTVGGMPMLGGPAARYENWKFNSASWFTTGLLTGATLNLPLNTKTTFTAKALIGGMYVSKPDIKGKSLSDTENAYYSQEQKGGLGFSYKTLAGLNWKLNDKISLATGISYFAVSSATFKDVRTVFSATTFSGGMPLGATESSNTTDIKQDISTLNVNMGLTFKL
jgi:hypothetical protein